ncbi:methyl-accepting chemotaxis protein [Novipirellula artificiosorum]|uniref:Methyl-accepting chemotaxis protein CtpH n=1 Tax=Novipirellula artificiosorum TaxID=2528016 RepID=A0A5C6DC76_9BACT|nr:methyl-accepting chemotaxis protein [Novipirellula artificiosorum]TWU34288.1 Methyl-accepting chemotaxis protein CtpH [Novipirellula artificiosorum]
MNHQPEINVRIVYKLLLATALPAALIWLVGIYATSVSQASLHDAIEANSVTRAREVMNEIDWIIQTRATNWQAYLRSELVRRTLLESNEEFAAQPDPQAVIDQRDQAWQSTPDGVETSLMQQLLNNDLARDLRNRLIDLDQSAGYPVFGEVFLTNRFGANVAQTSRTSDYQQDDELWWQQTADEGVFIGDAAYDNSAGQYSIDLCLRSVDDEGKLMGILKAVMNIREVVDIVDDTEHRSQTDSQLILFNRQHAIIRSSNVSTPEIEDGSAYFSGVTLAPDTTEFTTSLMDPDTGEELLCAFAISRGHGDLGGIGWTVLEARKHSAVFAPVVQLRRRIIWLAILATLIVAATGWWIARSITRPIGKVLEGTTRIGQGDFDHRMAVKSNNEIGKLASAFNQMTNNLQQKMQHLKEQEDVLRVQNLTLLSQSKTLASQEEMLAAQKERDRLFHAVGDAVRRLNAASDDILETTSNQARGSQEQVAAVSQTAGTVYEVAQIAHQTSERANQMVIEASQAEAAAQEGRDAMSKSIHAIQSVRTQSELTAQTILSLAERAQAIGEMTATVNDIAEQTNVLALNAAVEASRAGELGQGFAVVARAVKELAGQSKEATGQVRRILSEILKATGEAVASTEKGTIAAGEAGNIAAETGHLVNRLLTTISDSARSATKISESASEQASGAIQWKEAMSSIESVAVDNAKALEQIEQAAMDLSNLSAELAKLTANTTMLIDQDTRKL